jgi:hypothetical protein
MVNMGAKILLVEDNEEQFTHAVRQMGFYGLLLNQVTSQNSASREYEAGSHAA